MASYQIKQREQLLDARLQATLERRGKELLGLLMLVSGMLVMAMLYSYSPDDPSWLTATEKPVHNWLGRIGAAIASPVYVIAGWGGWGIGIALVAWGLRFMLHKGEERAVGRMIFVPIFAALLCVYAASLVPGAGWGHDFGLGGMFGDTVLGALLNVLPVASPFGIKAISFLLAVMTLAAGLYAMGFTRGEMKRFARFLLLGILLAYEGALRLVKGAGRLIAGGGVLLAGGIADARARRAARKARQREAALAHGETGSANAAMPDPAEAPPAGPGRKMPRIINPAGHGEDPHGPAPESGAAAAGAMPSPAAPQRQGLLDRLPSILKRQPAMPEPELVEPEQGRDTPGIAGGEERIKAKIADAIRARVRQPQILPEATREATRTEPKISRPNRPEPMILDDTPPLTASAGQEKSPGEGVFRAPAPRPEAAVQKPVVQHPPAKAVKPSRQALEEAQPSLLFEEGESAYEKPPLALLANPASTPRVQLSEEALEENARMLESVLDDYGVKGEIVSVRPGPVVTMYELEPAPGLKASRVIGLADDIARSMSALSARVSTVPGRSVIGIELPNETREMVMLREILSSREFGDSTMRLPLALGKDIGGAPVVANLAKMPHLLIAGTTGSGKSVAINTMILSLLYKLTPDECRLIMIDPKMLELSVYDGIPHLLSPVVTDPKKAVVALKWVVSEMEERYRKMSKMGVRNIEGYNGRVREALAKGEMFSRTVQTGFDDETGEPIFETEEFAPETLPYIVVIVDEMADLMMVAGKEIEACIQRLAQMARASGIHLIMATQRPSVDVITGTIKANFPTRISFQVTSKVDSRTILGEQGAEQLLGMGDMLYMAGGSKITRVHGPFVSDEEVEEVVNHLKSFGPPEYVGGVLEGPDAEKESELDLVLGLGGNTSREDALYDQAVQIVIRDRKCSTSYIQRKLAIGYNKAARLVEQMEEEGLISPANHVGKREILVPEQQ